MDNGLIFPYPCTAVHAESVMLSLVLDAFGLMAAANRSGSRQAEGETQEASSTGRWLSRSKGVGRLVGKSASYVPET